MKRRLGEEGTRDSGELDFVERSMITRPADPEAAEALFSAQRSAATVLAAIPTVSSRSLPIDHISRPARRRP